MTVVTNHYADFSGRASRRDYWVAHFQLLLVVYVPWMLLFTLFSGGINTADKPFYVVIGGAVLIGEVLLNVALVLPIVALWVRRLHDIERSGWWVWLMLIPYVGGIWLIFLASLDGTLGPNSYGPDPRATGTRAILYGTGDDSR